MASIVTMEAVARARAGKGAARATRREGKVPGVIYGAKRPSQPDRARSARDPAGVARPGWQSRVYELSGAGGAPGDAPVRALIRDVQVDQVSDAPEHVDFQRLAPGERIRVTVPVHFDNEGLSTGLKRGGVLNVVRHAVEVTSDPDAIPSSSPPTSPVSISTTRSVGVISRAPRGRAR